MRVMCIERSSYLTNSDSFSIEVGDSIKDAKKILSINKKYTMTNLESFINELNQNKSTRKNLMRVMCIERSNYLTNSDSFSIEVGDWLEVYNGSKDYVTFEMNNQEWYIERNKFITVQQWRQKQLDKII